MSRRILVVEDEPDERFLAASLLEETGFAVIEAETADHALAILNDRADEVSVVFSDVRTPGPIGGFDAAGVATAYAASGDEVPVVLVSVGRAAPGNWPQKPRRALGEVLEIALKTLKTERRFKVNGNPTALALSEMHGMQH